MRIEKPVGNTPRRWWPLVLIAVGICAGAGFYYYSTHEEAFLDLPFLSPPQKITRLPPLEITNFTGRPETYSRKGKKWMPLERGTLFASGDRIRTDAQSEVDIRADNQATLRLKENSELERKPISRRAKADSYRLYLIRGLILGATERKAEIEEWLEVSTPAIVAAIRGTVFAVKADEPSKKSWIGVLRGTVEVQSTRKPDKVSVHDMEKAESNPDGTLVKPVRVSQTEWNEMKEAYELIEKNAAEEAGQLDLSLQAGGLFKNVFDHGTFFTPKVGYAWRTFEKNADGKVILSIEYDVFPRGAFVGMYMKIKDLNLMDYESLQMRVSRVPETGYPEAFKIEVKSKGQVVRAFTPKVFKKEWQTMRFPFRAAKDTPVSEIVFVFSNEKAGEFTRGALRFSDVQLLPKKPEETPVAVGQQAKAASSSVSSTSTATAADSKASSQTVSSGAAKTD